MGDETIISYEGGERAVAARIASARSERGWSQQQLSDELAKVGCHIHYTAIQKLENGKKPRKITVDELFAFAMVFQIPVEQMLVDPSREVTTETWEALKAARVAWGELEDVAEAYLDADQELVERLGDLVYAVAADPARPQAVRQLLESMFWNESIVDYVLRESKPAARKKREAEDLLIPEYKTRRPWEGK